MWWYRYEFSDTYNTHAQLFVHATLLLSVRKQTAAGRLLAAALNSRHTYRPTLQLPLHSQLCLSVYKIVMYG